MKYNLKLKEYLQPCTKCIYNEKVKLYIMKA